MPSEEPYFLMQSKDDKDNLFLEISFKLNLLYDDKSVNEIIEKIMKSKIDETLIFFNKGRNLKITKVYMNKKEWDELYEW